MATNVPGAPLRRASLNALTVLAALAWLMQPPARAYADMPERFAHITCAPELGLFELDNLLAHPPFTGDPHRIGAYGAQELEAAPQTCALLDNSIVVSGENLVMGRGPCGAELGQRVRVTINGAVVAHRFSTDARETTLSQGWIELSQCFDGGQTVTVRSSAEPANLTIVEVCSRSSPTSTAAHNEQSATVMCHTWQSGEAGYPFTGALK